MMCNNTSLPTGDQPRYIGTQMTSMTYMLKIDTNKRTTANTNGNIYT